MKTMLQMEKLLIISNSPFATIISKVCCKSIEMFVHVGKGYLIT